MLLMGCKSTQYLPKAEQVGTNTHGAYIIAIEQSTYETMGELIAADSTYIIILNKRTDNCDSVAIAKIAHFKVRFARTAFNKKLIPIYLLSTVLHGIFAAVTVPLNLLVMSSIIIKETNELQYTEQDISFEQMRMFARFPAGLPKGVRLEDIK